MNHEIECCKSIPKNKKGPNRSERKAEYSQSCKRNPWDGTHSGEKNL